MKKITLLVCSALAIQSLWLPAFGGPVSFTSPTLNGTDGIVDGKALPKVIGPLHLSEGLVIMKHNHIIVLSDAKDPIEEAELSGELLQSHAAGAGRDRTIRGIAFFTGGYSLPALDDLIVQESIRTSDGVGYFGRISDLTPDQMHMKTNGGVKVISTKEIAEIRSPRAFAFSIPVTTPSLNNAGDVSIAAKGSLIAFSPTYTTDLNTLAAASTTNKLHAQLSERHLKKRLFTAALFSSYFVGCFALPIGIALTTRRPQPSN